MIKYDGLLPAERELVKGAREERGENASFRFARCQSTEVVEESLLFTFLVFVFRLVFTLKE